LATINTNKEKEKNNLTRDGGIVGDMRAKTRMGIAVVRIGDVPGVLYCELETRIPHMH
jgi:hypothetical protein